MDSSCADGAISDECTIPFGRDPPGMILWLLLRRLLFCLSFVAELVVDVGAMLFLSLFAVLLVAAPAAVACRLCLC
eukprot:scaffold40078_cov153-Skeletonema_marinoi.AAC.1